MDALTRQETHEKKRARESLKPLRELAKQFPLGKRAPIPHAEEKDGEEVATDDLVTEAEWTAPEEVLQSARTDRKSASVDRSRAIHRSG